MIAFFILLLLVLILGDIGGIDFDHDIGTDVDTGLSPLSLPVVAVFGTSFGGYGTLLEILGFSPIVVPILAAVFAGLTAGGMYAVMLNVFVKTQAETRVDLETLAGYKGQVLVPIRPGQPGQIVVITEARGRTLLQAIADEPIGTDEHVVVDSAVGNSVKVHKA
jgi:membrane-bound ClpP family serine protease